eukprot:GHVT01059269.1.p1 GENE.GHVT01059269.1~~GHVT01059269.1.p1  ORF type:complete len:180 (-),score=42.27 GHVT01059269.1:971-1510(-)
MPSTLLTAAFLLLLLLFLLLLYNFFSFYYFFLFLPACSFAAFCSELLLLFFLLVSCIPSFYPSSPSSSFIFFDFSLPSTVFFPFFIRFFPFPSPLTPSTVNAYGLVLVRSSFVAAARGSNATCSACCGSESPVGSCAPAQEQTSTKICYYHTTTNATTTTTTTTPTAAAAAAAAPTTTR